MEIKNSQIQKLRLPLLILWMLLLTACAPAIPVPVEASLATPLDSAQITNQVPQGKATENLVPSTDQPTPLIVATSRGPNLEATDPSTVNLASDRLQLVEFFRFT